MVAICNFYSNPFKERDPRPPVKAGDPTPFIEVGFLNFLNPTTGDGVYFDVVPGGSGSYWRAVVLSGGVPTIQDWGQAVPYSDWVKLKITCVPSSSTPYFFSITEDNVENTFAPTVPLLTSAVNAGLNQTPGNLFCEMDYFSLQWNNLNR
jgi:hypothetical protein